MVLSTILAYSPGWAGQRPPGPADAVDGHVGGGRGGDPPQQTGTQTHGFGLIGLVRQTLRWGGTPQQTRYRGSLGNGLGFGVLALLRREVCWPGTLVSLPHVVVWLKPYSLSVSFRPKLEA